MSNPFRVSRGTIGETSAALLSSRASEVSMSFRRALAVLAALSVSLPLTMLAACGDDEGVDPSVDAAIPPVDAPLPEMCAGGPLAAPIVPCMLPPLPTTGDPAEDCVRRINQFRAECQCLPPLQRFHEGEVCAQMHGAYDSEHPSPPHAAFRAMMCLPTGWTALGQNECPAWPSVDATRSECLQLMWDEGPGPADDPAHGHYLNMSSTTFTHVACGFHTDGAGKIWAVQNFARF